MSAALQRFTPSRPCPVCGGHHALPHGQGRRCYGYQAGDYARCTREDRAGALSQNTDATFSHYLAGECRCGLPHQARRAHPASPQYSPRRRVPQSFRTFESLSAYLRMTHGNGPVLKHWIYHRETGEEAFRIVRVNYFDANDTLTKSYRPCYEGKDGRWRLAAPSGRLPLYSLPHVIGTASTEPVIVVEGEKCVHIARSLGLGCVTTSAHGAQAPQLADWSPLAGRSVVLMPDAGERGGDYASKVAAILSRLSPPATIGRVALPGLAVGEDIEQWAEQRTADGLIPEQITAELAAMIQASLLR